jgi:MFS family permease
MSGKRAAGVGAAAGNAIDLGPGAPATGDGRRARRALAALNFFMADMQAGIGPFLGVFLQQRGWQTGPIGTVMTAGGIAGMAMTVPAGAFIDHTPHKRWVVVITGICTVLASFLLLWSQAFVVVAGSQVATAIAGAAIGPAVAGITLGVVRQRGFNAQNGRNQAWNHAGNMIGAGLSGWLGWRFGMPAIFFLAAAFGVVAIIAVLSIPERAIDHRAARGLEHDHAAPDDPGTGDGQAEGFRELLRNKPLLILAAALACFHLGNGAMLPLYGLAVVGMGKGDPAMFTATTVMVAQAVMIVASLVAMKLADRRGYWLVLLISFAALPLRGLLAGTFIEHWGVWPVQALDGIGAGLQSVAVPGLIACLLDGSGRVNVGQGAVMTVQGWAPVSPRDRRLARADAGLPRHVPDPGRFCPGQPGAVDRLCRHAAPGLRDWRIPAMSAAMPSANGAIWAIATLSTAGVIARPMRWPEWIWAVTGAALLVLTGLLPVADAGTAIGKGLDVYLFLTGMMLLSEAARQHGVFDWIAAAAVNHARGSRARLFTLVYATGALVTTFLSNDATAVVLTPAVFAVARQARAEPLPLLFACALIANAASFVLPISNPANLVLYGGHMPPLGPGSRLSRCRRSPRSAPRMRCCAGPSGMTCKAPAPRRSPGPRCRAPEKQPCSPSRSPPAC